MARRALWGVLAAVLIVVAARAFTPRPAPSATPASLPAAEAPPVLGTTPAFDLTDQNNRPFASSALAGKIWVADFIFTSCAGICPIMTGQMAGLQERLPETVGLISFSVDPERDLPEVRVYAERHGARYPRWRFLTGEPEEIRRISEEGFRLGAAEAEEGPIIHSTRFVLVDHSGQVRGYYDGTDPAAVEQLVQATHTLLEQG